MRQLHRLACFGRPAGMFRPQLRELRLWARRRVLFPPLEKVYGHGWRDTLLRKACPTTMHRCVTDLCVLAADVVADDGANTSGKHTQVHHACVFGCCPHVLCSRTFVLLHSPAILHHLSSGFFWPQMCLMVCTGPYCTIWAVPWIGRCGLVTGRTASCALRLWWQLVLLEQAAALAAAAAAVAALTVLWCRLQLLPPLTAPALMPAAPQQPAASLALAGFSP